MKPRCWWVLGCGVLGLCVLGLGLLQVSNAAASTLTQTEVQSQAERYNAWCSHTQTLRAGGKARVGHPNDKDRGFRFALVLSRPDHVRLQGRLGNLTTLFDMVSKPGSWKLVLPGERKFYEGTEFPTTAGFPLTPEQLTQAVFPNAIDTAHLFQAGTYTQEQQGLRLVIPPSGESDLHRIIWLDHRAMPTRLEVRRHSQLEEPIFAVTYAGYEGRGLERFPMTISFQAEDGSWARFQLESLKRNERIDPRRFSILVPPGSKQMPTPELSPDFLPESDGS